MSNERRDRLVEEIKELRERVDQLELKNAEMVGALITYFEGVRERGTGL